MLGLPYGMMDGKSDFYAHSARRFETSGHRRARHALRRWRVLIWTALCAGILFLINGVPLSSNFTLSTDLTAERVLYEGLQQCYETVNHPKGETAPSADRHNPRWNAVSGQKTPIAIQNATLFDGETTLPYSVDIVFDAGVVRSVTPTNSNNSLPEDAEIINVHGKHVTPGLVDLHSHHALLPFPSLSATSDANERPLLGPITPFVRATDGFTPSDPAIKLIASGGVTSSLVLPGSANIVGGQAYPVKNLPYPGAAAEPVIDELLLEDGIQESQRQRYLKMACGENPRRVYGHTRMGLAWLLRKELNKAKELLEKQEAWCAAASKLQGEGSEFRFRLRQRDQVSAFVEREGPRPDSFDLETFLALLRGEINLNVHCYTPEDLETMLSVLHEFGVHPRAFHHALEAWQVPELLKRLEPNVTIATFADSALYKAEAYDASLQAPKILHEHGVRVALKSDHTGESDYAKYLLDQASVAHSYGLLTDAALQSVTSIPAESMQQGHRIGYMRLGYDADLVIWDSHPLQVGATAVEVFIDGRPLLRKDLKEISKQLEPTYREPQGSLDIRQQAPATRPLMKAEERGEVCKRIQEGAAKGTVVFTGIKEALLDVPGLDPNNEHSELVLVLEANKVPCLGSKLTCLSQSNLQSSNNDTEIPLQNGYITPGLIAFGNNLGIQDIPSEPSTGDGTSKSGIEAVHFAKYGVHLHGKGKAFGRARIGGATKAVTPPHGSGVLQGVSVGIRTGPGETLLDGGVWRDEVALHFSIGQGAKVGSGIETIRRVLEQGNKGEGDDVFIRAANESLPVVVQAYNPDDIAQLILIKRDFPRVNLVIYGGHGAALLAKPLADADIPVILTGNRGAPDTWEKKDTLPGPPLSDSPAKILLDAGVLLGLAAKDDSKIHGLAREARWAGKFAGLDDTEAIRLVSTNFDEILGLSSKAEGDGEGYKGDFVLWEGNPLSGEGSVVISVKEDGSISDCWPEVD
ncbi:uncharacterized protein DSM5745_08732 [Aspergillus mulundensis]|uniref:Amidohydrolase-related domain-containing protein n=1 Tax=Aspergillus mulundensis TaxID=1810919 RepID=A0A3D8R4H8_9EURO|nr:Uncharacterized protein DSM5745_08732 [Aspergillus mulundensis]RDW68972.1 Uncharacterized protein DSM5745_08732 [Aspergillus mulundensis]